MSVFRRRREEPTPSAAGGAAGSTGLPEGSAPTTMPVARDPDLAVPPFRPATKEAPMSLPPKPTQPPAGMGMPPRPGAAATAASMGLAGGAVTSRPTPAPERRTMVVGKGISLQGTVTDAELLVVEGTVESTMMHAAELQISHSGVFKGEVEVEDAEIAGTFDGTLTARGNLIVRATGKVLGVARCRRLSVEEGGQLSGRMEMLSQNAGSHAAPQPLLEASDSEV